jgi:hypothetical protein
MCKLAGSRHLHSILHHPEAVKHVIHWKWWPACSVNTCAFVEEAKAESLEAIMAAR